MATRRKVLSAVTATTATNPLHINGSPHSAPVSPLTTDTQSKSRTQMIEELKLTELTGPGVALEQPGLVSSSKIPSIRSVPTSLAVGLVKPVMGEQKAAETTPKKTDSVDGILAWEPVETLKRGLAKCSDIITKGVNPQLSQTPPSKKMRASLVKPKFDVKYADHLFRIGGARYLLYGEVDGKSVIRIQECDYKKYDGEKQEPKMIRFTVQQWWDLVEEFDNIDNAIEDFDDLKVSIGGNTFVRVQTHRMRVDIREFFLPEGTCPDLKILPDQFEKLVVPTRRGISLTYEEWKNLVIKAAPLIRMGTYKLSGADARQAPCLPSHQDKKGWLICPHCNPNGYKAWAQ
jgi:hypothetical protein